MSAPSGIEMRLQSIRFEAPLKCFLIPDNFSFFSFFRLCLNGTLWLYGAAERVQPNSRALTVSSSECFINFEVDCINVTKETKKKAFESVNFPSFIPTRTLN